MSVDLTTVIASAAAAASTDPATVKAMVEALAVPPLRAAGQALEAAVELGSIPILWARGAARVCMEANLRRLNDRMLAVEEGDRLQVRPELAVPILERLAYVSEDTLAKMYVELVARAADKSTVGRAHPSFVNVISGLSPDDALLLKLALGRPVGYGRMILDGKDLGIKLPRRVLATLAFPENLIFYIENLDSLGLVTGTGMKTSVADLDELEAEGFPGWSGHHENGNGLVMDAFQLTTYGRRFAEICCNVLTLPGEPASQ